MTAFPLGSAASVREYRLRASRSEHAPLTARRLLAERSMADERPAVAGLSGFGRCGCSGLRVCDEPFAVGGHLREARPKVSPHRPMLVLLAALERHPDGGASRL